MAYNNSQRAFLQAMLANPFIDINEGKKIVARIRTVETNAKEPVKSDDIADKDVFVFVSKAAQAVSPYDLTVRDMLDQEDGQRVWALVNASDDDVIRFATLHSPDEISYFKRLLDAIFDTYNTREAEVYAIKTSQALNVNKNPQSERKIVTQGTQNEDGGEEGTQATQYLSTGGAGLSKVEAQDALKKFYEESWLEKYEGFYFLTTRALLELEVYLLETYNVADEVEEGERPGPTITRVRQCVACRYVHTIGLRCSNLDCDVRVHEHCVTKYLNGKTDCPKCHEPWTGETYVGPKAAVALDPTALRAGGGGRKFMRDFPRTAGRETYFGDEDALANGTATRNDYDDDEEEPEEEQEEEAPTRPNKRQSTGTDGGRVKRSRPSMPLRDDDEDEEEAEGDEEGDEEEEEEEPRRRPENNQRTMKNLRLSSPDEIDDIVLRRSRNH